MKKLFVIFTLVGTTLVFSYRTMPEVVSLDEEVTQQEDRPEETSGESFLPTIPRNPVETSIEEGKNLLDEGSYEEAALQMRVAVMLDPSNTSAWFSAIEAYDRLGKIEDARKVASEMARHHPDLTQDWSLRKYLED